MRMTLTTTIKHTANAQTFRTWAQAWLDKLGSFLPVDADKQSRTVMVSLSIASPKDVHETLAPSRPMTPAGAAPIQLDDYTPPPAAAVPQELHRSLLRAGWTPSSRAWPDFFAVHPPSGAICIVAARRNRGRKLRSHQRTLLLALSAYGVPCYRWSPDYGYERIGLSGPDLSAKVTTFGTIGGL